MLSGGKSTWRQCSARCCNRRAPRARVVIRLLRRGLLHRPDQVADLRGRASHFSPRRLQKYSCEFMHKVKRALPLFLVVSSVRTGDGRIRPDSSLRCNCGTGEQRQCSDSTSSRWWRYFLSYGYISRAQHDVQHSVLHVRRERRAFRGQRRLLQHNQSRFVESMLDSHARCACMPMSSCCCPHVVVHMLAGRSVRQYPASQPASICSCSQQPECFFRSGGCERSVQFSSVVGYRLSVIGYPLSVISPHVVVRMPFDLDPVFLNT